MKKFHFFSVAVAVVMALFVCVWAGSLTFPFGTLNGIIPTGQKTAETAKSCVTLNGSSSSSLISPITVKGLVDVNQYCKPATQCRVLMYREIGTNLFTPIGSVVVPCGTSFSTSPYKTIAIPSGQPANGRYCFAGEVTLLNPAPGITAPANTICGISYTSGSAIINW